MFDFDYVIWGGETKSAICVYVKQQPFGDAKITIGKFGKLIVHESNRAWKESIVEDLAQSKIFVDGSYSKRMLIEAFRKSKLKVYFTGNLKHLNVSPVTLPTKKAPVDH